MLLNNKVNKIWKSGSKAGLDKLLISPVKSGSPGKSKQFSLEMLNEKRIWNLQHILQKINLRMISIQIVKVKTLNVKKLAKEMNKTSLINQDLAQFPFWMTMTMKILRKNEITSKRFIGKWLKISNRSSQQRLCLKKSSESGKDLE